MRTRRGQAMVELAAGMFAIALVVSALTAFAVYIVRSLRVQNSLRGSSPEWNVDVEIGDFAEKWYADTTSIPMNEKAIMPPIKVK